MEYKIKHNIEEGRFEAVLDDNIIGFVDYHLTRDSKALIVPHTEVNSEYEGRGIAAALTKELLEYSKERQLGIIPVCPYTKAYIERHPEYQDLLQ